MIVAGTGHRPDKLGGYSVEVEDRLTAFARDQLQRVAPSKVISGMALGWDQALAQAALDLGIPLIAAVPFEGFGQKWPKSSQYRCTALLCRAAEVATVSPYPGTAALHRRNEWMVDRCDLLLALWDGSWGGTFNCIQYARKVSHPIEFLWDRWAGDSVESDPDLLV